MSNTFTPMNWKMKHGHKGLLNVHNFKTKPPYDKWSIYHMIEVYMYKRQLLCQKKNDESSTVSQSFLEKAQWNKVKTERSTTIYEWQKIMNKDAPLNVRNF